MHTWQRNGQEMTGGKGLTTRRVLIALTLMLLLTVSVGVGVVVADWPHVRQILFQ
jgi:hypothetical protein